MNNKIVMNHALELIYKLEEKVEGVKEYGVGENIFDEIFGITAQLRSVVRNGKVYKEKF